MPDADNTAGAPSADIDMLDHPGASEWQMVLHKFAMGYESVTSQWRRMVSLNAHERLAIAYLWQFGPMTMSELGERIPLSRAAVTSLTDRLERMGYLRRVQDHMDRRRTMLHPTGNPRDDLEEVLVPFRVDLDAVIEGFDEEEQATVRRFVDEVYEVCMRHTETLRVRAREARNNPS